MIKQKYKIGISGHRDLKSSEIPKYKEQIRDILTEQIEKHQDKEVYILTPLAEGADQLVAMVARELGLRYEVILPMPLELYRVDCMKPQGLQGWVEDDNGGTPPLPCEVP